MVTTPMMVETYNKMCVTRYATSDDDDNYRNMVWNVCKYSVKKIKLKNNIVRIKGLKVWNLETYLFGFHYKLLKLLCDKNEC